MDSQDLAKVGDGFRFNWAQNVTAQILEINETTYFIQINGESVFGYLKDNFHVNYTFNQKLTDEYLIKDIIE